MEEPITYLYRVTQFFFFKTDLLIYDFIGKLFFCLSYIIITIPYDPMRLITIIIFKPPLEIVNHFHFKDVLPEKLCSGLVYKFKCNSCNTIYYGKTKHHFYVRAVEHMGISHLTNKGLQNVKQSAISDHLLTCNCNINFNDFTMISDDSNNIKLLIKESLLISCDKPILNKTIKYFQLELFE